MGKAPSFIKKFLGKKDPRQKDIADFHTTIIRVDHNFISSSTIMLDEMLTGNIYSLLEVIIAGDAEISGNIVSRTATISGKVTGDITSTDYAEIKSTGVVQGKIRTRSISIEAGATINGAIYVEEKIDDRDLIDKVKNRLPSKSFSIEPPKITYMLFEDNEAESKTETDVPQQPKKPAPGAGSEKRDKPEDPGQGAAASSSNNWY